MVIQKVIKVDRFNERRVLIILWNYTQIKFTLMRSQMIRVISSPWISTTGPQLIFDIFYKKILTPDANASLFELFLWILWFHNFLCRLVEVQDYRIFAGAKTKKCFRGVGNGARWLAETGRSSSAVSRTCTLLEETSWHHKHTPYTPPEKSAVLSML